MFRGDVIKRQFGCVWKQFIKTKLPIKCEKSSCNYFCENSADLCNFKTYENLLWNQAFGTKHSQIKTHKIPRKMGAVVERVFAKFEKDEPIILGPGLGLGWEGQGVCISGGTRRGVWIVHTQTVKSWGGSFMAWNINAFMNRLYII